MTEVSEPRTAILHAAEPQLYVSDLGPALDFYVHKLGFRVAFSYGAPAFYAQVFRDGARLNLAHVDIPPIDPALRDAEQFISATITLADAKPLFLELQAAGVTFTHTLRREPWGAHTFCIRDPDGNLLLFAGQAGG